MHKRKILYSLDEIPTNSKIAIYGAGKIGVSFKSYIEDRRTDIAVACFIDTFQSGTKDNVSILKVDELQERKIEFDIILVCSSHWDQIEDILIKSSYTFSIISNELLYNTVDIRTLGSFRFGKEQIVNAEARLKTILPFFEGEDKEYFRSLMQLRLSDDESRFFDILKPACKKFRTAYLDYLPLHLSGNVVLEGGVSDGTDSVNFFNFFRNPDLKIYGFEPFIEAFNSSPNSKLLAANNFEIFPWALWDEDKDLTFNKNDLSASTSSVIRQNGGDYLDEKHLVVRGVTIDSFVEERGIDTVGFIKLDIEGAEMEALKGAMKTIKRDKPYLAICIYHKKEHLIEVPEILKNLNRDYTFKIGFYSPTFIDTVLYAIPAAR
jgi:FkbM family methyltransferase